jgi:hypothetical protein
MVREGTRQSFLQFHGQVGSESLCSMKERCQRRLDRLPFHQSKLARCLLTLILSFDEKDTIVPPAQPLE